MSGMEIIPRAAVSMRVPAIVAVIGMAVLALSSCSSFRRELRVRVTNSQEEMMRDVTVTVTGATYGLGDIVSEASKSVVVEPTGESSAIVQYKDALDQEVTLDLGAYFEPGYRGTISVTVYPGGDSKVVVSVRP